MAKKFVLADGHFKMSAAVDFHFELVQDRKTVRGGGRWRMDKENKVLYLWDTSQDFGSVKEDELRRYLGEAYLPRLSGYAVRFSEILSDTLPDDSEFRTICILE